MHACMLTNADVQHNMHACVQLTRVYSHTQSIHMRAHGHTYTHSHTRTRVHDV